MKKSKYNFLLNTDTQTVIYNLYNDELALIDPVLQNLYETNECSGIAEAHPEFHEFLVNKGFLVEDDIDESFRQRMDWSNEQGDNFSITINPTLNCNMRCWYCYEDHNKHTVMGEEVVSSIKALIDKKTRSQSFKHLDICFFGGEPLLLFGDVVYPLSRWACELCEERGKTISIGFVTNAYLLSEEVLDKLGTLKVDSPISFQITLDGNQHYHDLTRHTLSGSGSYTRIMENIKAALKRKMSVVIRFNYTKANVHSFIDVLSDLKDIPESDRNYLSLDLHRVWQDPHDEGSEEQAERLRQSLKNDDFQVRNDLVLEKYYCYADQKNHVAVNYNGDLFHCTARDFTNANSEGVIDKNGDLLWNEKSQNRDAIKFGNPFCMDCSIYPLCHGTCSTNKLESSVVNGCYFNYREEEKKEIVERRIKSLLEASFV